jgi:hypothetical protein
MSAETKNSEKHLKADRRDLDAINHLKVSVAAGKNWYISLLEAIKMWHSAEERYKGRRLVYLIDGEAFDWLELAERLSHEIMDSIPEDEMINLLFYDIPPLDLSKDEFHALIGSAKYKAYLNYTYGVLVEEALIETVVEEVRKEKRSLGSMKDDGVAERAYKRIYRETEEDLLKQFMKEKGYNRRRNISLGDIKEFMYWLFKYRVKNSDNSRVASDTKKALLFLQKTMPLKRRKLS